MARLSFAIRMLKARFSARHSLCPYCDSKFYHFIERKWVLIQARKCMYCGLIYRWPTDSHENAQKFYEGHYEGQQATDIPESLVLSELMQHNFSGTQYDKESRVRFIQMYCESKGKFLDFGCSWGYSLLQYKSVGFQATGYELDRNRARYGRDYLKADIRSDWEEFGSSEKFDVILADHSLEHVPNPGKVLEKFSKVSNQKTKLIIFVPNGSSQMARKLGVKWGPFIGESHTVAFTSEWFIKNLPRHGFSPRFYSSEGDRLVGDNYLSEFGEIALVADRNET